ncbi:MAG TPA: bifunctional (p)ppGpp synthetase/guanosine-3',5'-bis(diphosphate) 3'-pyrophosphohydrolase [Actinomycetota bacterium]|jgi:GTP pyrophosphokinase|nr:bifunctional (p)ppGpp synthetase/guanosine-3',5'-bis(diphosphate) 3'-pyrophosphohydrolase [Actinomycetota bacterium]
MAQAKQAAPGGLRGILRRLRTPRSATVVVPDDLKPLLGKLKAVHPRADLDGVTHAYQVAAEVHAGQRRLSGDDFITHPLAVGEILADMGMDPTTIIGALLHDAVEDTDAELDDFRAAFGDEVVDIVDGLTKIAKISFRSTEAAQAENYRKMMVAMARDVRVIIIKLADRLHNMRTLDPLAPEKRELKARETLEVYVPLASRLGMFQVRTELEDLSFRYLYDKRYREIVDLTNRRQPERDAYLVEVLEDIRSHLDQAKIQAEVSGRAKNFYSIYQKMVERGVEFDDIFDLVGVRIVVHDLRDCYAALGVIHAMWKPIPGRFKDYIAMPKFNMYQSLHTSVMGPEGKPLEIQIRTRSMHEMAEYGIAAHWKYKESDGGKRAKQRDSDVPWLGELVESYREAEDPREFMESLRLDLFHDEVFCFTPKGDVVSVPKGSSPVDFAYAIHTEVGHRTVGARVNGALVPLDTRLESGDVVEILTTRAQDARPKEDWLGIVKTSRARSRIRHWLTAHRREEAREEGRELFLKSLRRAGIAQSELTTEAWRSIFSELKTSGEETLYEALGEGRLPTDEFIGVLKQLFRPEEAAPPDAALPMPLKTAEPTAPSIVVKGTRDVAAKLARCCAPVPGDEIFGFITRGRGVSVHRVDCPNARTLATQGERVVEVEWDSSQGGRFTVVLQVSALDRTGLLRDISDTLTDAGVMILSSSSWAKRDGTARLRFAFELADVGHLDHIQRVVRRVEGVFDSYRVLPLKARQG